MTISKKFNAMLWSHPAMDIRREKRFRLPHTRKYRQDDSIKGLLVNCRLHPPANPCRPCSTASTTRVLPLLSASSSSARSDMPELVRYSASRPRPSDPISQFRPPTPNRTEQPIVYSTANTPPGDRIVCVVQEQRGASSSGMAGISAANKVKRGDIRHAVVVRTRYPTQRRDGSVVRFDDNACVLLNKAGDPVGSRINGAVGAELKRKKWSKILSMAPMQA